ncbi:MAG: hydrogenase maturation protease [Bacteroidia bacterium]|nr:hydrogenase maturation protease [Bacteroidia bacterium]NNF30105.1 hydrogenase maturation protease [Flavobacteriaceae bacterium]MBT8274983.1 hydrogenase maturation protease [Bacteroidia bacterium]NNJ80597.1 hydrogenase maturation protease [Flavobacteriaceae bacterium]NNK55532.1 hydrogenase maturation protease [Flavobacteriaceae bacterium]
MKDYETKILLLGIGNSGRSDDGLGWAFLDAMQDKLTSEFDLEYRYQLQIEDAELISNYDVVYFIDAHLDQFAQGYHLEPCLPLRTESFSTHQLDPRTVVYLCESIYNKRPETFTLGISGVAFDLNIGISAQAKSNLSNALNFFENSILELTINK